MFFYMKSIKLTKIKFYNNCSRHSADVTFTLIIMRFSYIHSVKRKVSRLNSFFFYFNLEPYSLDPLNTYKVVRTAPKHYNHKSRLKIEKSLIRKFKCIAKKKYRQDEWCTYQQENLSTVNVYLYEKKHRHRLYNRDVVK